MDFNPQDTMVADQTRTKQGILVSMVLKVATPAGGRQLWLISEQHLY